MVFRMYRVDAVLTAQLLQHLIVVGHLVRPVRRPSIALRQSSGVVARVLSCVARRKGTVVGGEGVEGRGDAYGYRMLQGGQWQALVLACAMMSACGRRCTTGHWRRCAAAGPGRVNSRIATADARAAVSKHLPSRHPDSRPTAGVCGKHDSRLPESCVFFAGRRLSVLGSLVMFDSRGVCLLSPWRFDMGQLAAVRHHIHRCSSSRSVRVWERLPGQRSQDDQLF